MHFSNECKRTIHPRTRDKIRHTHIHSQGMQNTDEREKKKRNFGSSSKRNEKSVKATKNMPSKKSDRTKINFLFIFPENLYVNL